MARTLPPVPLPRPLHSDFPRKKSEQRRHWDGREFDEYIIATRAWVSTAKTPEEYLCRMETLGELMAVLDTCTEAQRCRFLLYAWTG